MSYVQIREDRVQIPVYMYRIKGNVLQTCFVTVLLQSNCNFNTEVHPVASNCNSSNGDPGDLK